MTIQQAADAVNARLAEDQDPGDAEGTPEEQAPAAPPAVPASSKPPVDVRQLQKHATQSLQKWGVVADALGLEKDTPVDVLRAHLEERLEAASRGAGEDEEVDPAAIRRIRSLENREWKAEESIYGEMAIHARSFYEKVRARKDMAPADLMVEFAAAVQAYADAQTEAAPIEEEPEGEAAPPDRFRQEAPIDRPTTGQPRFEPDMDPREREQAQLGFLRNLLRGPQR